MAIFGKKEQEEAEAQPVDPDSVDAPSEGGRPSSEDAPVVGAAHWQALVDIERILPCEVQPVNSEEWIKIVSVRTADNAPDLILSTDDGRALWQRNIGDPIKVRTTLTDAKYKH